MKAEAEKRMQRPGWPIYASRATGLGMIVCFAAILIQFLGWADPSLDQRGVLMVCTLAALEAFLSFRLLGRLAAARQQIYFYRGTEVVIILIILKFFTELRAGTASFWGNFLLWPVDFPFHFLTLNYVLTTLSVLASWWAGNLFATDTALLGAEESKLEDDERLKTNTVHALIQKRFLRLGILVVLLAAIPAQNELNMPRPVLTNSIPAGVAYFVLGTILLSLSRYASLENVWQQEKLKIPVQIPRRWFAYSALILAALVLLVSLLPTNFGLGFFATVLTVFRIAWQTMVTIFLLFQTLFNLLMSLLGKPKALPETESPQATPPVTKTPTTAPIGLINWGLVQAVLEWGILIGLAVIALRQYILYNKELSEELHQFRPLDWLVKTWKRLMAAFRKTNQTIGTFVQTRLERLRRRMSEASGADGEWNSLNVRRLPARQKVLFFYLAMVRRAGEAGLPRKENQTPYEYGQALAASLSEAKEGVDRMTEAFIEARYSRHDIPNQTARQAQSVWETIRRVLKTIRKASRENHPVE